MNIEQLQQQLAVLQAENDALKNQVTQLLRAEQTLKIILEGTVSATGDDFFHSLVQQLAKALKFNHIFVGELVGDKKERVRTLAYWKKDRMFPNFEYVLLGTPCATVVGNELQYYPQETWKLFPDDKPLAEKRIECYLGAPLFDSSGQSIGILVVMDDRISDSLVDSVPIISTFAMRAAAELERKQRQEALRESQDRYRQLVEQSLDAIFFIHKNRFELVNDSFCRLLEVTPETVYAPDFDLLSVIHPSSRPEIEARIGIAYSKDMPSERFEFTAQTVNGRPIPVEVSLSYMEYKDGTAVQGILHDLSIQKAHEARQQHQRELAEALHETGIAFSASLEIDVILDLLLEQVSRIVPYDTANVILVEKGSTALVRARGYEKLASTLILPDARLLLT
jgi:PAS domain S-box-containing protein